MVCNPLYFWPGFLLELTFPVGKSTLLEALELGVYNKVPGDGREFVVCDVNAVKVRPHHFQQEI